MGNFLKHSKSYIALMLLVFTSNRLFDTLPQHLELNMSKIQSQLLTCIWCAAVLSPPPTRSSPSLFHFRKGHSYPPRRLSQNPRGFISDSSLFLHPIHQQVLSFPLITISHLSSPSSPQCKRRNPSHHLLLLRPPQ